MTSSQIEPKYKDKETKKTVILKFKNKTPKPHLNSYSVAASKSWFPKKTPHAFYNADFVQQTLCVTFNGSKEILFAVMWCTHSTYSFMSVIHIHLRFHWSKAILHSYSVSVGKQCDLFFFMSEAGKWLTLWVSGMPMFVRGNILKPFSSSARPEKCHGISNRQQVMRQQNRISSILPNTVTRLCGDLDEIFWRPKILKLNVCVDHLGSNVSSFNF